VALGAKLGRPQAPVIAVHGDDGGFLMNSQEIETAVRHNIGVVTIVMNNNCWGSETAYQKHFYGSRFIGIGNPR
jgi:acetolactate synthase I/II/III large subunit